MTVKTENYFRASNKILNESEREEFSSTRKMGSTLLDRAEQIYKQTAAVRHLVVNAQHNPTRFGCSVLALVTGLTQLYQGETLSGGMMTCFGAKEIYNQSRQGNTSTLEKLLNDVNADVDMIKTLEEGQKQSYKVVEENLGLLRRDVASLYAKLDQIQQLNSEGLSNIEEGKAEALAKGDEAKKAYDKALLLFEESKKASSLSKETYVNCANYFSRIQEISKDNDPKVPVLEKVNQLARIAKKASKECNKGMNQFDVADVKFFEAIRAFALAAELKSEAFDRMSRVVQSAEDTLRAGKEKAEYVQDCKKTISATQQELTEIKERSDDIMRLLNEMSRDVKKAKEEAANKLDPSDVIIGVGAGVMLSSVGTISAMAAGVTAAYSWHNGTTIATTTQKIYRFFFGASEAPPMPMHEEKLTRVSFNERSSGYFGAWVKGRSSYTFGTVDINFGQEVVPVRFNLNDPDYPISKEDLFALYSHMHNQLEKKTLSPERCKEILQQLEEIQIYRSGLFPIVRGLIRPEQAASGLVRALRKCADKLLLFKKTDRSYSVQS